MSATNVLVLSLAVLLVHVGAVDAGGEKSVEEAAVEAYAIGIPFSAKMQSTTDSVLLSSSQNCEEASCTFTVPFAALNSNTTLLRSGSATLVRVCHAVGQASMQQYNLDTATLSPKAASKNTMIIFQLSDNVPIGTQVQFYKSDTYNYDPVGGTITLASNSQISVTAPETEVMYVCAKTAGSVDEWEMLTPVPVIDPFTTSPATSFRYGLRETSASTPMANLPYATDATCAVPVGEYTKSSAASVASTLGLSVVVPRGTYAVCAQLARKLDLGLLPSHTKFTVSEYGITVGPFMYANTSTHFDLTLDAVQRGNNFESALLSGERCTGDVTADCSSSKEWVAAAAGTYYPCVR